MAETPSHKRPRDEPLEPAATHADAGDSAKRQKPYDELLSLLDEDDEDETTHHDVVSDLITTLQQELSSPSSDHPSSPSPAGDGPSEGEDERERVMRHLLEASDDELGLPRSESSGESGDGVVGSGEGLAGLCGDGGLWELEDEAANYYALMQSELFMM